MRARETLATPVPRDARGHVGPLEAPRYTMSQTKPMTPPAPLRIRCGVRAGVIDVLPGLQTGVRATITPSRGALPSVARS